MEGKYKSNRHKVVMVSERVSDTWVQTMITKYGLNSPVVKIRALGVFAEMEANQLIALAWLEDSRDIDEVTDGSIPRLRLSIDVADGGEDFTVITVARIYDTFTQLVKQYEYSFPSSKAPIMAAQEGIRLFNFYNGIKGHHDLVVDAIGVGAGTAGYLMQKGYKVIPHKGGAASTNKIKYRNKRTQCYINYRDAHRDCKVRYSPDFSDDWEDYIAQVCSIKTNPSSERIDDIETKQAMTNRGVKSPDKADSAAMVFTPVSTSTSTIAALNEQFNNTVETEY